MKSFVLAVLAVLLFAVCESKLGKSIEALSVDLYVLFRFVLTAPLFLLLLYLSRSIGNGAHAFPSPFNIDRILWIRAVAYTGSIAGLALALSGGLTQAAAYPFFFVHPIFQLWIDRKINGKPVDPDRPYLASEQLASVLIIGAGIIVFAVGELWTKSKDELIRLSLYAGPAVVAGVAYGAFNFFGDLIKARSKRIRYAFNRKELRDSVNGLAITGYTTFAATYLLPLTFFIIAGACWLLGAKHFMTVLLTDAESLSWTALKPVSLVCLGITAGIWLFTVAINGSKAKIETAALDGLIIPFALVLSWWQVTNSDNEFTLTSSMLAGSVIIFIGVFVPAILYCYRRIVRSIRS